MGSMIMEVKKRRKTRGVIREKREKVVEILLKRVIKGKEVEDYKNMCQ